MYFCNIILSPQLLCYPQTLPNLSPFSPSCPCVLFFLFCIPLCPVLAALWDIYGSFRLAFLWVTSAVPSSWAAQPCQHFTALLPNIELFLPPLPWCSLDGALAVTPVMCSGMDLQNSPSQALDHCGLWKPPCLVSTSFHRARDWSVFVFVSFFVFSFPSQLLTWTVPWERNAFSLGSFKGREPEFLFLSTKQPLLSLHEMGILCRLTSWNVLIQLRFSSLQSKTLDVYEPIDGTFVLLTPKVPGLGLLTGGKGEQGGWVKPCVVMLSPVASRCLPPPGPCSSGFQATHLWCLLVVDLTLEKSLWQQDHFASCRQCQSLKNWSVLRQDSNLITAGNKIPPRWSVLSQNSNLPQHDFSFPFVFETKQLLFFFKGKKMC